MRKVTKQSEERQPLEYCKEQSNVPRDLNSPLYLRQALEHFEADLGNYRKLNVQVTVI